MQTFKDVTFGSVAEQKRFERILMYTVFIDVSIHVEKNNSQTLAEAPTYLRTWSLHTSTKAIHAHGSCHRLPPTPLHTRVFYGWGNVRVCLKTVVFLNYTPTVTPTLTIGGVCTHLKGERIS